MPRQKPPQELLDKAAAIPDDAVEAIWGLWRAVHGSGKGRAPELTTTRIRDIRMGLADYGFESCVRAVIGSYFSPWHMGDNPLGKRYTSIELLMRWGDKWRVAKFSKLYDQNKAEATKMRNSHYNPNPTVVEEVQEQK